MKNYKNSYIRWIKYGVLPTEKIPLKTDYIYPDDRYIWLSIFNNISFQLFKNVKQLKYSISEYYDLIESHYDSVDDKSIIIPCFKKVNWKKYDLKYFDDLLIEFPSLIQLLLNLFKKVLGNKFYKINFNVLSSNDVYKTVLYDNYDLIPYYELNRINSDEAIALYKHINNNCKKLLSMTWKDPNNHYIEIDRRLKSVGLLTVGGKFNQISNKNNMNDDNYTIINIFDYNSTYIKGLHDLEAIFEKVMYTKYDILTQLDEEILKYCNAYAKQHVITWCVYWKIKKILKQTVLKLPFTSHIPNMLKYTSIYPNSKYRKPYNKYN